MSSDWRTEALALVRLGMPIVIVQVGMMMMGMVDTMMIGHLSGQALEAVALGHLYVWGIVIFAQGVLMAIDPQAARRDHRAEDRSQHPRPPRSRLRTAGRRSGAGAASELFG